MGMSNLRFVKARKDYDCNACEHIKDRLDEIMPDLNEEQKAAVELAKSHNWKVLKGEQCRRYTSNKGTAEEMDCVEIPAIAQICIELKLWM
jgi:hypothetical protein